MHVQFRETSEIRIKGKKKNRGGNVCTVGGTGCAPVNMLHWESGVAFLRKVSK